MCPAEYIQTHKTRKYVLCILIRSDAQRQRARNRASCLFYACTMPWNRALWSFCACTVPLKSGHRVHMTCTECAPCAEIMHCVPKSGHRVHVHICTKHFFFLVKLLCEYLRNIQQLSKNRYWDLERGWDPQISSKQSRSSVRPQNSSSEKNCIGVSKRKYRQKTFLCVPIGHNRLSHKPSHL